MLFKLSFNNIKKSLKDYTIYFVTLILGVCIFYIFNSVDSQTAMMKMTSSTRALMKTLIIMLDGTSVFVSIVLGFLIIYASRFLIKKRNKEFGIYMLLGMKKKSISAILLIETFLIGLISLVIGLIVGVLLSQATSIFIANMFEADMTAYQFVYSGKAVIKTCIYFGIIYDVVMVFNVLTINKCKLIDLLNATKKNERITLKNPIVCIVLCVIAITLLAVAYYLVTSGFNKLFNYDVRIILLPIGMGLVGTYLFFYSISGLMLRIFSRCKSIYYKDLNNFVFKQLFSKINTMVLSMSTISILLFLTLCLLSSAFTIKEYFNKSITKLAPCDMQVMLSVDKSNVKIEDFIKSDQTLYQNIKNDEIVKLYTSEDVTYEISLGSSAKQLVQQYPNVYWQSKVKMISNTQYNKMADMYHLDKVHLNKDEYAIVSNYESKLYDTSLASGTTITVSNQTLKPYATKSIDGFYEMAGNPCNTGFMVVSDAVIQTAKVQPVLQMMIANYKTDQLEETLKLDERLDRLMHSYFTKHSNVEIAYSYQTKNDIKDATIGLSAMVVFIGLYLGIIFMISSAAIISLKELSDSIDDKYKYNMLRNIGADEKMISSALFKQTLIFFTLPLIVACVHTIFGIKFSLLILNMIGITSLARPIILTFVLLIMLYGGYFLLTYRSCKTIIKHPY